MPMGRRNFGLVERKGLELLLFQSYIEANDTFGLVVIGVGILMVNNVSK